MAAVLAGLPFELTTLAEYPDAPDVEETGASFVENALLKARAYAAYTGQITLADDSGLEVDALGGAPGVMSSRFAPSDAERIAKLLDMMRDVPDERRSARFRCAIAIARPDGTVETCEDSLEGVIARKPKGTNGFGYDPILFLPGVRKHVAQLPLDEKNAISHRGKALARAKELLAKLAETTS